MNSELEKLKDAFRKVLDKSEDLMREYGRYIPYDLKLIYQLPLMDMKKIIKQVNPTDDTIFEFIMWLIERVGCQIVHVMPCVNKLKFDYDKFMKIYEVLHYTKENFGQESKLIRANFPEYLSLKHHSKFVVAHMEHLQANYIDNFNQSHYYTLLTALFRYKNEQFYQICLETNNHRVFDAYIRALDYRDRYVKFIVDYLCSENENPDRKVKILLMVVKTCLPYGFEDVIECLTSNGYDLSIRNNDLLRYAIKWDKEKSLDILLKNQSVVDSFNNSNMKISAEKTAHIRSKIPEQLKVHQEGKLSKYCI